MDIEMLGEDIQDYQDIYKEGTKDEIYAAKVRILARINQIEHFQFFQ